jgi:protein gp37
MTPDSHFSDEPSAAWTCAAFGIHWVIVGGESGPGARPMSPAWVRRLRDQCQRADILFFSKQWGGVRKKLAGRQLDGRTHDAFPAALPPPFREAVAGMSPSRGLAGEQL